MSRIYKELLRDAEAILQYDPAAKNITEVMLVYPGFFINGSVLPNSIAYHKSEEKVKEKVPII